MPSKHFSKYVPWGLAFVFLIIAIFSTCRTIGIEKGRSDFDLRQNCTLKIAALENFEPALLREFENYQSQLELYKSPTFAKESEGHVPASWYKKVNGKLVILNPPDTTSIVIRNFYQQYSAIHAECGMNYDDPVGGTYEPDQEKLKLSELDFSHGSPLEPLIEGALQEAEYQDSNGK